jgi:hypothetical protein
MLTDAQQAARKGKLTASKVGILIKGDAEAVHRLWLEMTGQADEEDLSNVWVVQFGAFTEPFHLNWQERRYQWSIVRRGEVVIHPKVAWAACTLDGWVKELDCPIEAKHANEREPVEVIVARYAAQCTWQMMCCGAARTQLSIIRGNSEPVLEEIPYNKMFGQELMRRAHVFMRHVNDNTPPVEMLDAVEAPEPKLIVDMSNNVLWRRHALAWLQCQGAAETAKASEKVLKAMVHPTYAKASGHGVRVTRDRAGRLSLRQDNAA